MDLQHYSTAASIKDEAVKTQMFARVVSGNKRDTVGRIIDVRSPYFSQHFYRLEAQGKRPFWVNGEKLELLQNWKGDTHYNRVTERPVFHDMLGREITVGQTVNFPRMITSGSVEMIMGTVKRISEGGAIYVKPFMISDQEDIESREVRLASPARALIIDRGTVDQVLLAKMSSF